MLEKTYDPAAIETRIYNEWESNGCFKPSGEGTPYTIVIPPPNVTGHLHMGHALNNTLQDILCRFERMRGRDVLWQVGTDHAGIATQMVVERQLAEAGNITRHDMGREAFIERVWQWKSESGDAITQQLRRLGASCDWSRERFTMDEGLSKEVRDVFIKLYEDGLIYKDKRLVNWDPGLLTAISDLEVEPRETQGHLWHFNYPLENGEGHICVATTRPETMLGDTGVAVHPEDERYKHLIGSHVILPLVGRRIPIVADDYADPEQGSGAVKITPAHDFNDFEVGKRCGLAAINILDQRAAIDLSGDEFATMTGREQWQGLDRFAARKEVVAQMEAQGLLVKIEDTQHVVPYGDRSGQVIEPWLTDQWYVNAEALAKPAIAAVKQERTAFVPKNWEKTYFDWMENIQPWCISRQLWWGHRIPAWYTPEGEIIVANDEAEAYKKWGKDKSEGGLTQDEDVLDTWFSSGLWAFSTLEEGERESRYPTDVLVTGFDIIFFWVARMMMMGLHFRKEVPFKKVYVHALVRDAKGAKMSKSKGNVIDPLELIDKYGADALRFTLAAMASPGRDIKLSEQRVEGYRNFGTKLWNAARFCEMNNCFTDDVPDFNPAEANLELTHWLSRRITNMYTITQRNLEEYRFDLATRNIYDLIWNDFCDWYVEFAKPIFQEGSEEDKKELKSATKWIFQHLLRMLHPFMPFITEEVWKEFVGNKIYLISDKQPIPENERKNRDGFDSMEFLTLVIKRVRSIRSILNVPGGAIVPISVNYADNKKVEFLIKSKLLFEKLTRSEMKIIEDNSITSGAIRPPNDLPPPIEGADDYESVPIIVEDIFLYLSLTDDIDVDAARAKIEKDIEKENKAYEKFSNMMENKKFIENATPAKIKENQEKVSAIEHRVAELNEMLSIFPH